MSWLRDRLGRFSRPRSPAVAETAPSLSPMAQSAIEWLNGTPAGDRLAAMLAEPQSATRRTAEPESTPLEQVIANAAALAERPLAPIERDEGQVWQDLSSEGYTFEACKLIAEFSARNGVPPRKAAKILDAVSRPEPISSSRNHWRNLDRMVEAENDAIYADLMAGHDERYLERSIAQALREVRGG
jgi:hypothetical protein